MTNCCRFSSNLLSIVQHHQPHATHGRQATGPVQVQVTDTSERFLYHLLALLKDAEMTTRQRFRVALYRLFAALVAQKMKPSNRSTLTFDYADLTRTLRQPGQKALVKQRCQIRAVFILAANNDGFVIIRTW